MTKLAFLAAALAVLGGCTAGRPAVPPRERPTIVSLNPCSDAILSEVADPAHILAISHYSHDPRASSMDMATARRFAATGGTVEEILALKPDIVVAGTFMPPATRIALERFGIRVESFAIEHTVSESVEQVRELARLSGHSEKGEQLVLRIEQALDEATPQRGSPAIPAVVWQSGGIVPGPDALISDIMRRTGFSSHSAARGLRQADYLPLEEMLTDPPRLILVAGDSSIGEDRILQHPALENLADTRRHVLDPKLIFCGGPTIVRAAERLRTIRHALLADRKHGEVAG